MKKWVAGTVAGTCLVLGLVGCSTESGSEETTAGAPSAAAPAAPAGAAEAVEAVQKVAARTAGVESFVMDLTVVSEGTTVKGVGHIRTKPTAAVSLEMNAGAEGSISMVVVDGVMYMNMGGEEIVPGKTWMKVDLADAAAAAGADDALAPVNQTNPNTLATLFAASTDVVRVGEESVEGVQTVRYKGTIDATALAADPATKEAATSFGADGVVSFEIWIDGDDLMRKAVASITADGVPAELTMLFRDFGEPVKVTAPPADQVASTPAS
ncbi:LppX_LprAFG lipoprotein [Actinocorallia aurea]